MSDLTKLTLADARDALKAKGLTDVDVESFVEKFLTR
jgi:hypothetical protein